MNAEVHCLGCVPTGFFFEFFGLDHLGGKRWKTKTQWSNQELRWRWYTENHFGIGLKKSSIVSIDWFPIPSHGCPRGFTGLARKLELAHSAMDFQRLGFGAVNQAINSFKGFCFE